MGRVLGSSKLPQRPTGHEPQNPNPQTSESASFMKLSIKPGHKEQAAKWSFDTHDAEAGALCFGEGCLSSFFLCSQVPAGICKGLDSTSITCEERGAVGGTSSALEEKIRRAGAGVHLKMRRSSSDLGIGELAAKTCYRPHFGRYGSFGGLNEREGCLIGLLQVLRQFGDF